MTIDFYFFWSVTPPGVDRNVDTLFDPKLFQKLNHARSDASQHVVVWARIIDFKYECTDHHTCVHVCVCIVYCSCLGLTKVADDWTVFNLYYFLAVGLTLGRPFLFHLYAVFLIVFLENYPNTAFVSLSSLLPAILDPPLPLVMINLQNGKSFHLTRPFISAFLSELLLL